MQHAIPHSRMQFVAKTGQVAKAEPLTKTEHIAKTEHIERVLRCRKCFRSGSATWESTPTGSLALLALSEGFHRRARVPLSLPPEIVCNCGAVQPEH